LTCSFFFQSSIFFKSVHILKRHLDVGVIVFFDRIASRGGFCVRLAVGATVISQVCSCALGLATAAIAETYAARDPLEFVDFSAVPQQWSALRLFFARCTASCAARRDLSLAGRRWLLFFFLSMFRDTSAALPRE
jgi:hypothetical protein